MDQTEKEREHTLTHFREQIKSVFHIDDTSGIELFVMLHRVAHLSEMLESQPHDSVETSGPRWRLLLRLLFEEHRGNLDGLTPTVLSHSQNVSKNTISALLRGLEEQGLIQRNLDSKDLRVFRIQLTPAGREYVLQTAPKRLVGLNHLLSSLSPDERAQLTLLLEKMYRSLSGRVKCPHPKPDQNQE